MSRFFKFFFYIVLVISMGILATVFLIEFELKIPPCKLCIYQRIPYFGLLLVGLLGIIALKYKKILSYIVLLLFISSVGLALYNVAIEKGWFNLDTSCQSNLNINTNSVEELKKALMEKDIISCDMSRIYFLSLSLAIWNFIGSIIMTVLTIVYIRKGKA